MTPKLSIVIPVHNGAKRIKKTTDQIIRQNYTDFELILVENGSNDDSWKICKELSAADSRIIAMQSAKGTSMARKAGALRSQGQYVIFSDQDDSYVNNQSLNGIVSSIENSHADIVQFNRVVYTFGRKRIFGVQDSFFINRKQLLDKYVEGAFGAYKADISTSVWDKAYNGTLIRRAVTNMNDSLCRGEDMYLNTFAFLDDSANRIFFDQHAYYVWHTGIGTSSSENGASALFEEYKIIKPTILSQAQKAHVGYEPIMRTHRETLNFLNWLVMQSILSNHTKEQTLDIIRRYFNYDFVREAADFFKGKQLDGSDWDAHIIARADLTNPVDYYNRVYDSLGNIWLAKAKYRTKMMAISSLRRLEAFW